MLSRVALLKLLLHTPFEFPRVSVVVARSRPAQVARRTADGGALRSGRAGLGVAPVDVVLAVGTVIHLVIGIQIGLSIIRPVAGFFIVARLASSGAALRI